MSLLHEIQEAVVDPKTELGPILLKLRLLANRLGSDLLEDWVKYESEGYPPEVDVPAYRQVGVSYSGDFMNIAWRAIDHPIPSYLIEKFCGKHWVSVAMRESIAAIDSLLNKLDDGGSIVIDTSNLILLLQDKIMDGMDCHSVTGRISPTAVREIQNTVRNRILELTMNLEKAVPGAASITIRTSLKSQAGFAEKVEQVVNMTVYGQSTMIASAGSHANIHVNNSKGDVRSVVSELIKAGIPEGAATEFAEIVASEEPTSDGPFGNKARQWLVKTLPRVATGAWDVGISVATRVLEEAAKRYYGLD